MMEKLRDEAARILSACPTGVLGAVGDGSPQALPVRFVAHGLTVDCLLPRWHDLAYWLEAGAEAVLLVIGPEGSQRWLSLRGHAAPGPAADWAALLPGVRNAGDLYLAVRLTPARVELVDEGRAWGARETLDLI
ncbi:MAG TPA: pyridoxamine 5'-phosphate oxidase family protein [Symbiobacteriaceae bacterium]|jgi:hypothetical protein|nr:pyridoxamine 5'-phosphate oxidase family protein [Symbiobacteriaceae bacterium]